MLHLKSLIFFFFMLFSASLLAAQSQPAVTLMTTAWQPYVQNDPIYKGYAYEIIEAAFKAVGYKVTIKFVPWDKAMAAVNKGEATGIFPEYYTEARKKDVIFSDTFSGGPLGLYKKRESSIHYSIARPDKDLSKTFTAFEKYKFGVVTGYANLPEFDNNENLQKVFVKSDIDNLRQLYSGKVQLIFIDKFTAEYILEHQLTPNYARQLEFMEPSLGYKQLYIAFSKHVPNYQKILEDFNRGLCIIRQNGTMTEIIDKDAKITGNRIA